MVASQRLEPEELAEAMAHWAQIVHEEPRLWQVARPADSRDGDLSVKSKKVSAAQSNRLHYWVLLS